MDLRLEGKKYFIPEEWINRWTLLRDYKEDVGGTMMELDASTVTSEQLLKWYRLNLELSRSVQIQPQKKIMALSEAYNAIQFFGPVDGRHLLYCRIDDGLSLKDRDNLYKELGMYVRREWFNMNVSSLAEMIGKEAAERANAPSGIAAYLSRDPYAVLKKLTKDKKTTTEVENAIELAEAIPLEILYGIYYNADPNEAFYAFIDWTTVNWNDLKVLGQRMQKKWIDTVAEFLLYCEANKADKYLKMQEFQEVVREPPSVLPTGTTSLMLMDPMEPGQPSYFGTRMAEYRMMPNVIRESLEVAAPRIAYEDNDPSVLAEGTLLSDDVLLEPAASRLRRYGSNFIFLHVQIPRPVEYFDRLYSYIETIDNWKLLDYMTGMKYVVGGRNDLMEEKTNNLRVIGNIIEVMWRDVAVDELPDEIPDLLPGLVDLIAVHLGRRCLTALSTALLNRLDEELYRTARGNARLKKNITVFCELAIEKAEDESLPKGLTKWYRSQR